MSSFESKLAWLAGLIDGEGCFTISIRKHHVSTLKITPIFSIQMRKDGWSREVVSILKTLKIKHHIRERKNQTEIYIRHWKNILPFINSIKQYSIVKRPIMEMFSLYKPKPVRNRFVSVNPKDVIKTAKLVSFVRIFNRRKNRSYKWDGNKILDFFGIKKKIAGVGIS